MMDKRTSEFLRKVGLGIPSTIRKGLLKTKKTESREDFAERLLDDAKTSAKDKAKAKEGLMEGKFAAKERYHSEPSAIRAVDEYYEAKIKDGIAKGIIKKFEGDRFTKKLREKFR